MTHCGEHVLGKLIGQKGVLCDTLRPHAARRNEEVLEKGERKRSEDILSVLFVCFLFLFAYFVFWVGGAAGMRGGSCRGG